MCVICHRVIHPADVMSGSFPPFRFLGIFRATCHFYLVVLVVDCPSLAYIDALANQPLLAPPASKQGIFFRASMKVPDFVFQ